MHKSLASQMLMCKKIPWGSCWHADSDSVGLGWTWDSVLKIKMKCFNYEDSTLFNKLSQVTLVYTAGAWPYFE